MDKASGLQKDEAPFRPVSSLRSHFENISGTHIPLAVPAAATSRHGSPSQTGHDSTEEESKAQGAGRASLDLPRQFSQREAYRRKAGENVPHQPTPYSDARRPPVPSASKPRPISMGQFSPSSSYTPIVTVESPQSSPKILDLNMSMPPPPKPALQGTLTSAGLRSELPHAHPAHLTGMSSRPVTPAIDAKMAFLFKGVTPSDQVKAQKGHAQTVTKPAAPPPVNRAAKPNLPDKHPEPAVTNGSALAPDAGQESHDEKISPFNTPPSSNEGSPVTHSPNPTASPVRASTSSTSRESYFDRPSTHQAVAKRRRISPKSLNPTSPHSTRHVRSPSHRDNVDAVPWEDRPSLPPRNDINTTDARLLPAPQNDLPLRRSADIPLRSASVAGTADAMSLPWRTQPVRSKAFDVPPARAQSVNSTTPRATSQMRDSATRRLERAASPRITVDPVLQSGDHSSSSSAYPDSSQANRKPPFFPQDADQIETKYDTRLCDVCGEYVCTTGYLTRAWNIVTGELVMSLVHGETTKMISIAFKPARKIEEEGRKIWVGTNSGELQEIDISTQSIVMTNNTAHGRRGITKILRHKAEMWTLDDEGNLHVWRPDSSGSPNMANSHYSFRVPKGHSFSLVCGNRLWMATGRELRVFQPTTDSTVQFEVLRSPLLQPNAGEITSGAIVSSRPDVVYFGHTDGKVSAYSQEDFSCLWTHNISVYRILCLVGVGDYLWAGFNTGMIYVYDTASEPWKVKKDWLAHNNPVAQIVADRSSIWKLDRLQVVSLGLDNRIRIWDGMLRDDWLETQMDHLEASYCVFRDVTSLVVTWNAGAVRPPALHYEEQDENFFRDLFPPEKDPPDVVVFGLQELVDLEDKRVMAKAFFKSRKKDASDQEHMSRQYRAWRDHLGDCLERYLPASKQYTLLHTASLVGLFTCVFVRTAERINIRDVQAADVKTGLGGQHGNKGAIMLRFLLDDSSLCFVNCHLAAGQTSTIHRNNDIAAILEASALPPARDVSSRFDLFSHGGDGSMILDHEICILNGDLNYRIDTVPRDNIIAAIKKGDLGKLLDRDQLLLSKKRNPGFRLRAFEEAKIEFAPTYKYDIGTDNYDTSEKKRAPAWCDRILYRGVGRVTQLDYRRHDMVRVSDHRPVSGRFRVKVKTVDRKARERVWAECERGFEEVKERVAREARRDYLVNVFGVGQEEAGRLLKG